MPFSWLKNRRRRRLREGLFPPEWVDYLRAYVPSYDRLPNDERRKLQGDVRVFLAEKHWEGCGGLTLTDEMRVAIAAQACLLILGLDFYLYDHVPTILVYPTGYETDPDSFMLKNWSNFDDLGPRLGEAWFRGPVILSWADIHRTGQRGEDGVSVALHEFAHVLDNRNGASDGTPPLGDGQSIRRWNEVMQAEFDRLTFDAQHGRATLLDHYGAKNRAEFFAVATECLFDRPAEMRRLHAELYQLLVEFYRQDPAGRL